MRTSSVHTTAIGLILVLSVSAITANPVPGAEITPPTPSANTETEPATVTTERITTTAGAAITTMVSSAPETTQEIVSSSAPMAENRTEPPTTQEAEANKEPSQGLVSFDQRQHGRFNIRADLDNFMIILLPQSTTKSPLLNLGGIGGGGGSSSSSLGGFGSMPGGSSLFDLFTRKAPSTKRPSRRKYKVKSSSYKRKYKEMLRRQAQAEAEADAEEKQAKEVMDAEPVPSAAALTAVKVHEEPAQEPAKKLETEAPAKEEIEERTSYGSAAFEKPIQDKYRMDTLEKIQHQLDILIKRVDAREANYERPSSSNMEHFVEGRTPYRVEIGSLTNEADVLPAPQHPIPFRQFRTDRPLEIGNHQPKYFQPWTFPSAAAAVAGPMSDNSMNPFAQRGPVMVAFRDGRSLGPRPEGNELRTNSILALPFNSLGFARAMEIESNEASSPSSSSAYSTFSDSLPPLTLPLLTTGTDTEDVACEDDAVKKNPYLNEDFADLTDTIHSFDSLNVDNVDKIDTPTQTAQFNQDWDLKLLGATDDCGPDRRRDSYGICQFVQF